MASNRSNMDSEIANLIAKYGYRDLLAGIARIANERGYVPVFKRLDRIVDWLTDPMLNLKTGRATRKKSMVG